MADLFIVKERLKFSLMLASVGVVLGAFATWYFYDQLEFETDRNRFLLSAVVTGAFAVGWFGLLIFFLSAKRIMDPSHSFTDRFDSQPWWVLKVLLFILLLATGGFLIFRYRDTAENEFELIRKEHFHTLEERIELNPVVLEKKNGAGQTLLQVAYQENYPAAVSLLIKRGAEVVELDPAGRNPVIVSLENLPMLGALLDSGLNPDIPDAEGVPAVHHAVAVDSAAAMKRLLDAGAKIDGRDRLSRTPLMQAVETDALPMIGILIERGAAVNAFDQRGDTALHIAVRRRNAETIRLLLKHGANPETFNFIHMTPLHIAALAGQVELVSIFLELPNMTELVDDADSTPLDLALRNRKYETATLLIDNGANPDRTFADGSTRLHKAILSKDYSIARFLIRAGARSDIPDKAGRTSMDIIRAKQLNGLIELIEEQSTPAE